MKVLHEVRKRHITQKQAGVELGISVRWVRTLLKRLRKEGDSALRHRLRGRASNRKTPEAVKRRVVELFRQKRHLSIKLCLSDSCGSLEAGLEDGIELWKYRTDGPARSFPTALLQGGDS